MKILFITLGSLCVALGTIGIVIPMLPTTPFLLLASYLFYRSSPKMRNWLINHRIFGNYIKNYLEHKAIPIKTKIVSISTLCITISLSAYYFTDNIYIRTGLFIIAIAVTAHLLMFKTLK